MVNLLSTIGSTGTRCKVPPASLSHTLGDIKLSPEVHYNGQGRHRGHSRSKLPGSDVLTTLTHAPQGRGGNYILSGFWIGIQYFSNKQKPSGSILYLKHLYISVFEITGKFQSHSQKRVQPLCYGIL